jgi:hypothetical protein
VSALTRRLAVLAGLALVLAGTGAALANGSHTGSGRPEPPTRFEAFLDSACVPCVRDTYLVTTVALPGVRLPGFAPQVASTMARAGEVRLELVRAYPLGKPSQQFLALRVTLLVAAGGGPLYRLSTGLVDEEQVPALAVALAAMAKTVAGPATVEPAPDTTEVEFHAGSVRVGTIRVQGSAVGYVQAGDVAVLPPASPVEAPAAVFLPAGDLPALQAAILQGAERIQKLRSP